MPRLLQDLDATFLRMVETNAWRHQFELAGADGVMFLCPKCWTSNGNSKVGTHSVICWFVGRVPDDLSPKPGRWTPSGTGLTDLTFVPGDPPKAISVHLTGGGCGWHGFVKNGNAE